MTDPADLAHAVLLRVAEFVRTLPADQLAALADGTAKLSVVDKARPARRSAAAPASAGVDTERVRADLVTIGDRAAGARYLADLKLSVPKLRALAKELGIAVSSKAKKADVEHEILQWTVGRRLDSAAISRPPQARS
ncbi:Rho termination factor N-terminal domain-containing protein [Micromonospora sp. NPDC000207]|uniref:Rho termination factor N-terminal domain-containing protein n=1 Tax=Micromonospora sp. NPDC000207 TaxID=3154246 RepID=UPI003325E9C1